MKRLGEYMCVREPTLSKPGMKKVYLSRRNLEVLTSKLDRRKGGDNTACSIIKHDTAHPDFPCSDVIMVVAIEDEVYYTDRQAGVMHPADDPNS